MTNTVFALGTGVFVLNSVGGAGKTLWVVRIGYSHAAPNTTRVLSDLERIRDGGISLQKVRTDDIVLIQAAQETN